MKRRSTVRALFVLPLILLAISCASTPPKPAEPTPEPEKPPVAAPETPVPAEAKAAAEKARAEAALFEAEASFPDEWKTADSSFSAGEKAYNVDNAASKTAYETAAKAFGDLAAKAKPLFLEKLAKARARAEKGRKEAFDLEAQTALPDDWKAAEAFFLTGRDEEAAAGKGTIESYPKALTAYESAADAFEALVKKALPLFADSRGSELEKARADAIAAGAMDLAPDRFAAADAEAEKTIAAYNKGDDYYAAYDLWKSARDRYLALGTGARAYAVKSEIDRRDLSAYDSGNYARAGESMEAAMSAYDEGKITVSLDAAEEAHLRYKLVFAKGLELYASDRGKSAEAQRVAAWELKAHVAVKAPYDAAVQQQTKANAAFKAEKYEDAAILYTDAEERFSAVRQTAAEKRRAAEEAMKAADERMKASEKTAQEADAVMEGGAR